MQDKGAHKDSQETTATPDQLDGSQDHPVQEETDMDPKDQDQQVQEAHTTEDAHRTDPDHRAGTEPTVGTGITDQDRYPAIKKRAKKPPDSPSTTQRKIDGLPGTTEYSRTKQANFWTLTAKRLSNLEKLSKQQSPCQK